MTDRDGVGGTTALAIVRAVTTIDADGDAAWRVLAVSSETHPLRRVLAEWPELVAPMAGMGEGIGVVSPLLFVASGPRTWARAQGQRLRREADDLCRRLLTGETDLASELAWLSRPFQRRGARFTAETWRALALRHLLDSLDSLDGEELATPAILEGETAERWLAVFYSVPPEADAEELEGLASRALEAWLVVTDEA